MLLIFQYFSSFLVCLQNLIFHFLFLINAGSYPTSSYQTACEKKVDKIWPFLVQVFVQSLCKHQTRAYPGFCSMTRLGVFLLPPLRDANESIAGTHYAPGYVPTKECVGVFFGNCSTDICTCFQGCLNLH